MTLALQFALALLIAAVCFAAGWYVGHCGCVAVMEDET
jgi:hypothetical protein